MAEEEGVVEGRALIVDDSKPYRRMLAKMLASAHIVCGEAADGAEGLKELGRAAHAGHPYDIVFLDLYMPGMNGHEALREIRAQAAHRDIPVVIISSSNEREDIVRCAQYGISTYILKPYDAGRVLEATRDLLERTRRPPAASLDAEGVRSLDRRTLEAARLALDAERLPERPEEDPVYLVVRQFLLTHCPDAFDEPGAAPAAPDVSGEGSDASGASGDADASDNADASGAPA